MGSESPEQKNQSGQKRGHGSRQRLQTPPLRLKPIPYDGRSDVPHSVPPELTKKQVLKAVSHWVRVHALIVLSERLASPAMVGKELGLEPKDVAYHFHVLEKLDLIELVEVRTTDGGRIQGKFYRGKVLPYFDIESWKQIDPDEKPAITSNIMAMCSTDITSAISAGTLNGEDNHISRTVMLLDNEAYQGLLELLINTVDGMLALKREAAARIREGEKAIPTKVHIIQFEAPGASEVELEELPEDEAA
jgi:hypothetical protein